MKWKLFPSPWEEDDRSIKQVLDEWSQWVGSPCKRLLSTFSSLQPVRRLIFEITKEFLKSVVASLKSTLAYFSHNLTFQFSIVSWNFLMHLKKFSWVSDYKLSSATWFWIGRIFLFYLLKKNLVGLCFSMATKLTILSFTLSKILAF